MAKSIQYTKITSVPSQKVTTNELHGRVRIAFAEFEAVSVAANTVVDMFVLPNNARIVRGRFTHDNLGSSTAAEVGYAAHKKADGTVVALDVNAYKGTAATTSAGAVNVANTIALLENTVINANEDGQLVTVTFGSSGTYGGTIQLAMTYVID